MKKTLMIIAFTSLTSSSAFAGGGHGGCGWCPPPASNAEAAADFSGFAGSAGGDLNFATVWDDKEVYANSDPFASANLNGGFEAGSLGVDDDLLVMQTQGGALGNVLADAGRTPESAAMEIDALALFRGAAQGDLSFVVGEQGVGGSVHLDAWDTPRYGDSDAYGEAFAFSHGLAAAVDDHTAIASVQNSVSVEVNDNPED